MTNSDIFFILYLVVVILFAALFLIAIPRIAYVKGKKVGKANRYGSMTLALGGALFFAFMMFCAYLESSSGDGGFAGVISGIISIVGIVAIIGGFVWRMAEGEK